MYIKFFDHFKQPVLDLIDFFSYCFSAFYYINICPYIYFLCLFYFGFDMLFIYLFKVKAWIRLLIYELPSFLILALSVLHSPVSTALATFHKFWCLVFLSFVFKCYLILLYTFLFKIVWSVFSFQYLGLSRKHFGFDF